MVNKSIPTYITEDEVKSELLNYGFDLKIVKRFGDSIKHIPICLVFISKNPKATEIVELENSFYFKVSIEH